MNSATSSPDHGALMDSVYRGQRHIYDLTRKYFLFGRDRLIGDLACCDGDSVLEIGCGTGRNLHRIRAHWPGVELFGLDISQEMLKSAQHRLGNDAVLAQGDATSFDAQALFGRARFDRVVISFALSMIPDWKAALAQSAQLVAPGGALHIVDFGDLRGIPGPARMALNGWLNHFHVTVRHELLQNAVSVARQFGLRHRARRGFLGYYTLIRLENPPVG